MSTTLDKRIARGEREAYFTSNHSKLHPLQEKLIQLTKDHPLCRMLGSADSITLLCNMIKFAGAKKCIDVGVFTGYSSLSWAMTVPDDGKVVACDVSAEFAQIGIPVWKEAGVYDKIDLRIGEAAVTMQSLVDNGECGTYDFVFIDADKTGYDTYYELALKLIRTDGIIAIDNSWFSGRTLNPVDPSPIAIRKVCDKIKDDERVTAVMVDIGDGVYIVRKN